ncbi:fatty acid CoA ligase family protein [Thermodesulfobacteriota bacterium]
MNHNIAETLPQIAEIYPDRKGLICKTVKGYKSWSFKEMDSLTDFFARSLSDLGVTRGDRVMLMVKPSVEFITLTFALFKIGAVIILIDPGMGYKNLLKCIGKVKPEIFIGILKAHLFKLIFPSPFKTVRTSVCIGRSFGFFGQTLSAEAAEKSAFYGTSFPTVQSEKNDPAAILFTTGSTGPPKGVRYEHGIFQAQLKLIRDYYRIGPDDIDQPAFPLFALFSTALGACSVIPEMNPAKPAQVDPAKFVRTIKENNVTYSFGSPAIWNVVSNYCRQEKITLTSVKKILMAGAPVPGDLLQRTLSILPADAEIHTPYGATESLPIASLTAREILAETWNKTRTGKGVCVGRVLPDIEIKIIKTSDEPIDQLHDSQQLPVYEIGEIIVKGPVVTRAYDNNDKENRLAKIKDKDGFWHRMGDLGYFDHNSRLWFCGRKGHRVITKSGTMYTVCCEAIFNEHPKVFRSALVGIGLKGQQQPVLVVELYDRKTTDGIVSDLKQMALENELTRTIEHFLIHPSFPVDIRHNAKIFREKLTFWADDELKKS